LDIYAFLRAVEYLFRTLCPTHALVHGIVNFELREAEGWRVYFDSDDLAKSNEMNGGDCSTSDVFSGDLAWSLYTDAARFAADCMGELAIHFRTNGQRVRFKHDGLAKRLEQWSSSGSS
jgi:hypothetical protein